MNWNCPLDIRYQKLDFEISSVSVCGRASAYWKELQHGIRKIRCDNSGYSAVKNRMG